MARDNMCGLIVKQLRQFQQRCFRQRNGWEAGLILHWLSLALPILCCGLLAQACHAAENAELPPAILAVITNGERLRQGDYLATGTIRIEERMKSPDRMQRGELQVKSFEETIQATFDFDRDLNSFRRKRARTDAVLKRGSQELHQWFVRSLTETVELRGDDTGNRIFIYPLRSWEELWPDEVVALEPKPIVDPGMWSWPGWHGMCYPFDKYVKEGFQSYEWEVVDEGEGIVHVKGECDVPDSKSRYVLNWWCDEKQGGQPIRVSYGFKSPTRTLPPRYTGDQSWEKLGDVWVIKTFSNMYRSGAMTTFQEMSFEWRSVNQPVSEAVFNWKTWNFPNDYKEAWDYRLGGSRPVDITYRTGLPYEISLERSLENPVAKEESRLRYWLIVINGMVIAGALGLGLRFALKSWNR